MMYVGIAALAVAAAAGAIERCADFDLGEAIGPNVVWARNNDMYGKPYMFPPECAPMSPYTHTYEWRAPADGMVYIDTYDADFDTVISVKRLPVFGCEEATSLMCNDDFQFEETLDMQSQVMFRAFESQRFLIRVGGFGTETGLYGLSVWMEDVEWRNQPCQEADMFLGSEMGRGVRSGSTYDAPMLRSIMWPSCDRSFRRNEGDDDATPIDMRPGYVFKWIAPRDGYLIADTENSDFDTVVSINKNKEEGGFGCQEYECSEDYFGKESRARLWVHEGGYYYIVLTGQEGQRGQYVLSLDFEDDDACLKAVDYELPAEDDVVKEGNTYWAPQLFATNPSCGRGESGRLGYTYLWTAPYSGWVVFDTMPERPPMGDDDDDDDDFNGDDDDFNGDDDDDDDDDFNGDDDDDDDDDFNGPMRRNDGPPGPREQFDTVLGIFEPGSCHELACNDDWDRSEGRLQSRIEMWVTEGSDYEVVVTGFHKNKGEFRLNINYMRRAPSVGPKEGPMVPCEEGANLELSGFHDFAAVEILVSDSDEWSQVPPRFPCAWTELQVNVAELVYRQRVRVGEDGYMAVELDVPVCGKYIQALELGSCFPSEVYWVTRPGMGDDDDDDDDDFNGNDDDDDDDFNGDDDDDDFNGDDDDDDFNGGDDDDDDDNMIPM